MIWVLLLILAVGAFVLARWYIASFGQGQQGERAVASALRASGRGKVLRSLLFQTKRGSTEVDLVLVSRSGVFVVEAKNRGGRFVGGVEDERWMQIIGYKNHSVRNPLRQNRSHVNAVAYVLSDTISRAHIHSLVVFSGPCALEVDADNVVKLEELDRYFASFTEPVLDDQTIAEVVTLLKGANTSGPLSRTRHVRHAKNMKKLNRQKQ